MALHASSADSQAGNVFTSLASFHGTNGANPSAALIQAIDGNLYGTTSVGGASDQGTAFRLTTGGSISLLASFDKTNGANPDARLLELPGGWLYGTTSGGGASNYGTIFRIATNGTSIDSLFSFAGTNGIRPHAALIQAANGLLYGATESGGASGQGTAFLSSSGGQVTQLVSFDNTGYSPYAELTQATDGHLYGLCFLGGASGFGAAYRMTTGGAMTILHPFAGGTGEANPYGGLVEGSDGNLYGTTAYGGIYGFGTVYRLSTNGSFAVIASFDKTNGAYPYGTLVQARDGYLYGTTQAGGSYTNIAPAGYGTLFKVSMAGAMTSVFSFAGTNGSYPLAGLAKGKDGHLYGTTSNGGESNSGTAFRLTVDAPEPPAIKEMNHDGTSVTLTWTSVPGLRYQVLHRSNLDPGIWLELGPRVLALDTTTIRSFTALEDTHFYRVAIVP